MTDWIPFTIEFLKQGEYKYHRDEGWIRDSQRKRLPEYLSDNRMVCVDVTLATGERLRVRKAVLFALQLQGRKSDPVERKPEDMDPYHLMMVERLQELQWPFEQCQYCGLPFPCGIEQRAIKGFRGVLVEVWRLVRWYYDADLKDKHESECVHELMRVPGYYTATPPLQVTSDKKRPNPDVRHRVYH